MALVRMLVHITGIRDGSVWPLIGGVVDVSDEEAAQHIRMNNAEPVPDGTPVDRDWRTYEPPPETETYSW